MPRLGDFYAEVPSAWSGIEVTGLTADSRRVRPGTLFLALCGRTHDARDFIPQAVHNGAAVVLAEDAGSDEVEGVPVIGVLKARVLKPGDTVALITPSTYVTDPDRLELARRLRCCKRATKMARYGFRRSAT